MSTDIPHPPSEVQLLHEYLGKQLEDAGPNVSLDSALAGFQEYYRQLRDVRAKVRQAEESLAAGKGKPLDVDALISRVRNRLAEQGVVE